MFAGGMITHLTSLLEVIPDSDTIRAEIQRCTRDKRLLRQMLLLAEAIETKRRREISGKSSRESGGKS